MLSLSLCKYLPQGGPSSANRYRKQKPKLGEKVPPRGLPIRNWRLCGSRYSRKAVAAQRKIPRNRRAFRPTSTVSPMLRGQDESLCAKGIRAAAANRLRKTSGSWAGSGRRRLRGTYCADRSRRVANEGRSRRGGKECRGRHPWRAVARPSEK